MANYQIWNKAKFNIGFNRPSGVGTNLEPGKFVNLTEDEIMYESYCMMKWLRDGVLYCPDDKIYELLGITRDAAIVAQKNEDIIAKIKQPMKGFTAWLKTVDSADTLQKLYEVACEYDDLPQKKAEMIEKVTGKSIAIGRKVSNLTAKAEACESKS